MKTCFYCGRELEPGQRCSCRGGSSTKVKGGASSAQTSASSTSANSASSDSSATYSAASADRAAQDSKESSSRSARMKKARTKPTKQVWNEKPASEKKHSFTKFITKVRSSFPSASKLLRPVMSYIWHPVSTIESRPAVINVWKSLIINTLFSLMTAAMVMVTAKTNSPFLNMLIELIFGKTDLFTAHAWLAYTIMVVLLWACVLILALSFTLASRLANRKMSFAHALDTVSISSIYMCFTDALIFISILFGTRGTFTLVIVALVIMGIAHFVSIRHDLALSNDATFNMLVVSYLMFYVLAQVAANIIIRLMVAR